MNRAMDEKKLKARPVVLVVLDGWGVAVQSLANAITQSRIPNFLSYISRYPTFTLQASGEATGLPWNEVGNSEVGHMSIGAGRIVYQDLSRITAAISNKTFFNNEILSECIAHVKKNKSTLHLVGMVSPGGVHSHSDHLYALLELAEKEKVGSVAIHVITDGRDTPYMSAKGYVQQLQDRCAQIPGCRIATLSGRFYAMDRDNHWDRIEKAYRAMCDGVSEQSFQNPLAALEASYAAQVYDEQLLPTVISEKKKKAATISDRDGVVFFNIRADRARQLTRALTVADFDKFPTTRKEDLVVATLTEYEAGLPVRVAFPAQKVVNCLAEVVSAAGLKQLHLAETEKYAHVTYFLNDGREDPFPGEDRIMIPSPSVESYDQKPEMSAREIANAAVKALEQDAYDFIAMNFANADMVAHTGNLKATIKAIEVLDQCFPLIVKLVLARGGAVLITADHGNAEKLLDLSTGEIDKEHSTTPVPCIIIANDLEGKSFGHEISEDLSALEPSGLLSDVAPTLLDLMGLERPAEMTGQSLLKLGIE